MSSHIFRLCSLCEYTYILRKAGIEEEAPGAAFWETELSSYFLLKSTHSCERVSRVWCGIIFLLLPELVLTDFFKQGPGCLFVPSPEIPDTVGEPKQTAYPTDG